MTSLQPHDERCRNLSRSRVLENDPSQALEILLALDRAVVEVSMQLYNVNERDRSEMRSQNQRLHSAARNHLPRLLKRARKKR